VRVARERGLPLQDPRDPTLIPQSEELKSALLELEVVARNFEIETVLQWWSALYPEDGRRRKALIDRGALRGLSSYSFDPELRRELERLARAYPSRCDLARLSASILESAKRFGLDPWVGEFLARLGRDWTESLVLIGQESRKRPLRIWLKEIQERLKQAPPVVPKFKSPDGLRIHRVDQAVSLRLLPGSKIHFFGVSASFFEPKDEGNEWLSARELEALSFEFGLPSRMQRAERLRESFLSWVRVSKATPEFHEFLHDGGGLEQESLELILSELPGIRKSEVRALPVHPRILPSLSATRRPPRSEVRIGETSATELPISFLSSMGDCAFTAYARYVLGLYDERDPDFDLSGDAFGNLIHAAIEALLSSRGGLTPEAAFEAALGKTATPAWIRSERLLRALRKKSVSMLTAFLRSEEEYRGRSGAELLCQEEPIELQREGIRFKGRMDRVDRHADGLILIDYKTGGSLPNAAVTRRSGKGLQLPAYALALQESKGEPVISAQYLELREGKTNRNLGFLFKRWNKGKKADEVEFPISTARSVSGSLVLEEPEEVWKELDRRIVELIGKLKAGEFDARPAEPKDCERCRYSGVCGRARAVLA
jgi:RecB family exonuclease